MTYCDHPSTFLCGPDQRCTVCYTDSVTLDNGLLLWPSQDDPASFDAERIIDWFETNKVYKWRGDGAHEFARNNRDGTYGYVWIMATLDLDYEQCYLLDVVRHDGVNESRQFLFVGFGHPTLSKWHEYTATRVPVRPGAERLVSGLHFFADMTKRWMHR